MTKMGVRLRRLAGVTLRARKGEGFLEQMLRLAMIVIGERTSADRGGLWPKTFCMLFRIVGT